MKTLYKSLEATSLKKALKRAERDETRQGDTKKHEIKLSRVKIRSARDVEADLRSVVTDINITSENDTAKLLFFFDTFTKSKKTKHKQIIAFDISDVMKLEKIEITRWANSLNYGVLQSKFKVQFFCDCESFKFHFGKINKKLNSFYIGPYQRETLDYTVKHGDYSVNPRKLGIICKHLMSDVRFMTSSFNKFRSQLKDAIKAFMKDHDAKADRLAKSISKDSYGKMTTFALKNELKQRGIDFTKKDDKQKLIVRLKADDAEKKKSLDDEIAAKREAKMEERRGSRKKRKEKREAEAKKKREEADAKKIERDTAKRDAEERRQSSRNDSASGTQAEEKEPNAYSDKKLYELRRELRKRKVDFKNNMKKEELEAVLVSDDNKEEE